MVKKFEKFSIKKSVLDLEVVDFKDVLNDENPIIFDTNFLFIPFSFKVDIIRELKSVVGSEFSLYIYEGTILELESVERQKDKNKHFLPLIVKMLHLYEFKIISSEIDYIDEQIVSNLNSKILIGTNDKALKLEIKKKGFKVLFLRQKKYLEIF